LFSGSSLGEGENATFDVIVAALTALARAQWTALRAAEVETAINGIGATPIGLRAIKTTRRVAMAPFNVRPIRRRASRAGAVGPLSPRSVGQRWHAHDDRFRCRLLAEASADTPDLLEIALDKPEYAAATP